MILKFTHKISKSIILRNFILAAVFGFGFCVEGLSQTPAFYNTNVAGSTNVFPLGSTTNKVQWIYGPALFNAGGTGVGVAAYAGNITKIYFQMGGTAATSTYTDFTIKLSQNMGTTNAWTSSTYNTGMTQCFYQASYTMTGVANAWYGITLQVPFFYNPSLALQFEMQTSGSGGCSVNQNGSTNQRIWGTYNSTTGTSFGSGLVNFGFDLSSAASNDAGVLSIDSPSTFCGGQQTIKATIKNFGRNQINPVTVNWSLNGTAQSSFNYTSVLDTAGKPNNTAQVTLGTYTFPSNPPTVIKAWTSNPNNVTDTVKLNDSATVIKAPSISGAYTINPSGSGANNFTSFTAAANALNISGVCGPVYITVAPGTYTEKFTLTNVAGTSAINTITIDGVDSTSATLTFSESTAAANIGVISLMGTSYVTIKNMRIVNTGATYGAGVNIQGTSNYNTVIACRINVAATSGSTNAFGVGICGSSISTTGTGANNTIKNNTIVGGYANIALYGTSSASFTIGNKVIGNVTSGAYLYGIYDYYQDQNIVTDNRVTLTSATNTYGIYTYYCQNNIIDRNIVVAAYMGLYIYNNNNVGTTRMSCSNNMVNMDGAYNYSTNYGMYALYNVNGDFKHNTVWTAPAIASGYASYLGYGSGCVFNNNMFISNNAAMYAVYCPSVTFTAFDYNIMYAPGSTYVYWGSAAYANLAALKTAAAPAFHANAIFKMPNFVSNISKAIDLHLSSATAADVADLATALTVDVDNDARCMLAPSIGADDSKYGAGNLFANYSTPDTVFINSPTTFANYIPSSTPSYKKWFVNGVLVASTHDLLYTFGATGTYTVKLVMQGCFQSDSITKSITVFNLTQKPIPNFISDMNTVPTNQNVNFKDLSTKGPSFWQWSVSPTVGVTFANGTNSNSQNPSISFANAGLYTICLWDSNAIGKSASTCKVSYILVQATINLCSGPSTTKVATGNVYDDGGQGGNYTVNKTCSFLIDPCASSVKLTFNAFSLASGTFLRVYDGIDNTATPLHTGTGFTGVGIPPALVANSGKMFIEFATGGTADKGFEATWTSVAGTFAPPSGKIIDPDTADNCGSLNTFTFVSNDAFFNRDAADYTWFFTNSQFPTFSSKGLYSVQYGFTTAGVYPIRLDVNGCGGVTSFLDTIIVVSPSRAPIMDFTASQTRATTSDVITLTDVSKFGTTARNWTITGPGSVIAVTGNSTSSTYSISLTTPGLYTVKLIGSNCVGADSITKTNYITIFNYCTPIVSIPNIDFAIKNVTFGRIDTVVNGEIKGFDWTNVSPALGTVTYRDNTTKIKNYIFGVKAVEAVVELGGTYNFSVTRNSSLNAANTNIWIDYNQDGVFQSTELAASSGALNGATFSGSISIPTNATLGITRMRIGTAVGQQNNLPCGANLYGDFNDYRVRVTPDLSAPVIKFTGSDTIYVEVGRLFTDPGFSVVDNITNPCPYNVTGITSGTQITSHPSTASYTVTATDAAGNVSIRKRTIMSSPDVTKPVITLNGISPITVAVGTSYTDAGATALDFFFGSLTSSIIATNTVNTAVTGTYIVTYNVTDAAGNVAIPVVRTVIVKDNQKPVITVSGPNPLYVEVFSNFTAPVATVTDNYCTGLTYNVSGTVNVNLLGTYTLTYTSTDCSGNDAIPVDLTVIVRDTKAPKIQLTLGDTLVIDVKTLTIVPEPGYVISDNYYNSAVLTLSVNYSNVKLDVVGNYPVRYYVSDPSGNVDSSHIRVYKIVDRVSPVITLAGAGFIEWKRWTPFVDPGAVVTDNYYTSLVANVDQSAVNIYLDGVYPVRFNVTDPSGNKATEVIRYVKVSTALASGIDSKKNDNMFTVYPNPNNGIFNIDLYLANDNFINITIFDANGKAVYNSNIEKPANNNIQIDLSNEAAGMYFIKVVSDKWSSSKSFSIKK